MAGEKAVDLLSMLRGPKDAPGLRIVVVSSTEPDVITLAFEGTKQALGLGIFEVPVACYPLKTGDRLLAFPLIGEQIGQRWGVIEKLNGGVTMATMQSATSLKVDGMTKVYTASNLVLPTFILEDGDRVSIAPIWDGVIKYVVLQKY
ncbi:MAG: hypothetical protein NHB14_20700 [Desulfosporosinus sp.]|nr:hypothetical protein [Desulfosporosinus sp.]